jgi:CubicO group peptidase (beta-lactamase class C family)
LPQIFEPGTAYGYSNASTNIAGYAASVVAGRTWEDLLTSRILTPLSLRASGLFAEDLLQHPVALGYAKSDGKIPAKRLPGWALPRSMGPAGGMLCCSAGDLARFGRMFVSEGRAEDGTRVLSQESVDIMHAPQVELPTQLMAHQWCCGPYRKIWGGAAVYGHSGTNLGGSSMLLWCPERQFAVATVVNVASQGYPLGENIFDVIFPHFFGLDKPKTLNPEAIAPVATPDPRRYVGKFEAFGTVMQFSVAEGKLYATEESDLNRAYGTEPVTRSELIPLGGDRFLPRNPALSGNRLWDVAFWGSDETGRATHYLNGIMPLRRVA